MSSEWESSDWYQQWMMRMHRWEAFDCTDANKLCQYREPHRHGFACDPTCPCHSEVP